jgi:hypothetical protein
VSVLTPIPEAPPKPDDKPVELDETGRVLLRAAEIVRERWCQGRYTDRFGGHCAVGAVAKASGAEVFADQEFVILTESLSAALAQLALALGGEWVPGWNDTPGRTAEEVVEALERAAYQC